MRETELDGPSTSISRNDSLADLIFDQIVKFQLELV